MSHLNLIVPALFVLCLFYGIIYMSIIMRDIWDQISEPFDRRAALNWLMVALCFVVIYALGAIAYQILTFCLSQLWP